MLQVIGLPPPPSALLQLDILLAAAATADLATQAVNAAAGTTISLGAFKKIVMLARVLRMLRLVRHSKVGLS